MQDAKNVAKNRDHTKRDLRKKRYSHKVRGVSPGAGRESMVENICERGSETEGELWMVRVVS